MSTLRRVLFGIVALLLIAIVVIGAYGFYQVRRPYPQTTGTLQLAGLQDEVRVVRDKYGVPHIYAQNEADLFFAQGYVHAQDRFWQMEFWRHIGQGRISEIAGAATVEQDEFIRTMGWNRIAADTLANYEANEPEMMGILESYSAGVNAYVEQNRDNLSLNLAILQLANGPWEIEPWEPIDTIGWGTVMAYDLSGNYRDEILRAEMIERFGPERAAELLPTYPANRPIITPSENLQRASVPTTPRLLTDWAQVNNTIVGEIPELGFAFGTNEFAGSNSWTISGELTESGLPLMADDPHLQQQMPSIWYETGLHAPGFDVVGFTFAGVPGVIIGHNGAISWGVTTSSPDVQDLYIERLNPDNANQYEVNGEWVEMELITETIKVNGGEDVTLQIRTTRHGPVMSEQIYTEEELTTDPEMEIESQVLALRWIAAEEPSRIFKSVIGLNRAQNYEQFREALRYWDLPSQNFVYADSEGNIAYQLPGLVPIRTGDSLLPVPGWTDEYEWQGTIPYEEMPAVLNPPEGYILTANNQLVDSNYPYLLDPVSADGDRAARLYTLLNELLAEDGKVGPDDMATMQFDSRTLLADSYLPLLADLQSDNATTQAALDRLEGWDGQLRRDSVQATIFEMFMRQLSVALLGDEVSEVPEYGFNARRVMLHAIATSPNAEWWDDTTTDSPETQEAILLRAMDATVADLSERLGDNMDEWQWGDLHAITFVSNPLGQSGIGPVEGLVNRGPFPADGGGSVPNANNWNWANPAQVTGHVSMRMIIDFSDIDATRAVIGTGQSGHPYHPHYIDQAEMWLNGQYHPFPFSEGAVQAAGVETLVLEPVP